jgi:hypothetical protein
MTELLRLGIAAVRELPPDRQDLAGRLLLELATSSPYQLTPEQIEDLQASIEEADRGIFATEDEVAEMWRRFER